MPMHSNSLESADIPCMEYVVYFIFKIVSFEVRIVAAKVNIDITKVNCRVDVITVHMFSMFISRR